MIIYNVTIKVEHSIAGDWRSWMLKEHIPMLIDTGCFTGARLFRLLEQDDTEGPTFCAQYTCATREDYERYISDFATRMREESFRLWGNRFIAFRSLMEAQE